MQKDDDSDGGLNNPKYKDDDSNKELEDTSSDDENDEEYTNEAGRGNARKRVLRSQGCNVQKKENSNDNRRVEKTDQKYKHSNIDDKDKIMIMKTDEYKRLERKCGHQCMEDKIAEFQMAHKDEEAWKQRLLDDEEAKNIREKKAEIKFKKLKKEKYNLKKRKNDLTGKSNKNKKAKISQDIVLINQEITKQQDHIDLIKYTAELAEKITQLAFIGRI